MKFILAFCLIVSLASIALASSASWGRRNSSDYLLFREEIQRNPIYNNYWNINVKYPYSGYGNKVISAIYVYDRFTNTSGAIPSLYAGGPKYTHATVNLRSQYSRGIKSTIEIYGK